MIDNRICRLIGHGTVVAPTAAIAAVLLLTAAAHAGEADDKNEKAEPQTLVTISKETTYITSPLTERGFVDYPGWWNQKLSEGVTPENNAMILYLQAFGTNSLDYPPWLQELWVQEMGEGLFDAEGPFLVTIEQFVEQQQENHPDLTEEEFTEMVKQARLRPWQEDEFPLVAEWIKINDSPMQLVLEGIRRSHCYCPIEPPMIFTSRISHLLVFRTTMRILLGRAMANLADDEVKAALSDLFAAHRLLADADRGATTIHWMIDGAIRSMVNRAERSFAASGRLTVEQLKTLRESINRIEEHSAYSDVINTRGRIQALDFLQCQLRTIDGELSAEGSVATGFLLGDKNDPKTIALDDLLVNTQIDWNAAFNAINDSFDALHAASMLPTLQARENAVKEIDEDLFETYDYFHSLAAPINIAFLKTLTAQERGRKLGLLVGVTMREPIPVSWDSRRKTDRQVSQLGIAVLIHRERHGELPETLEDLIPEFIDKVPTDAFNGQPLIYRQRGDEFAVYSVGANGKDDGGTDDDDGANASEGDIVFATLGWK